MREIWIAPLFGLVVACGVEAKNQETIRAGETAQALGVSHYTTERSGDQRIINVFVRNGPGGVRDYLVGRVSLRALQAGEIGFEDEVVTNDLLARENIIRVHYQSDWRDEDVATLRGDEKPGVDCPQNREPPQIIADNVWSAALTDAVLAPFLKELELTVLPVTPENFVQAEDAFDGFPHVGTCGGHRVLVHTSGYSYSGCSQNGATQYTMNDGPNGYWCQATRTCWGGGSQGGNGQGPTNCCNSNCDHPSPGGTSAQEDCGGFSANGCKVESDACGCNFQWCNGDCQDQCGNYAAGCCSCGGGQPCQ